MQREALLEAFVETACGGLVDLSAYEDYADAARQIGRFLDDVYLHKRIHSALGYLTPAEFEAQWRTSHALTQTEEELTKKEPI